MATLLLTAAMGTRALVLCCKPANKDLLALCVHHARLHHGAFNASLSLHYARSATSRLCLAARHAFHGHMGGSCTWGRQHSCEYTDDIVSLWI